MFMKAKKSRNGEGAVIHGQKAAVDEVTVDYPQEKDVVSADHGYAVRVRAWPGAAGVEVSIDGGEWFPCRQADGFWWYDWSGFSPGEHVVSSRARREGGKAVESSPRRFRSVPGNGS